MAGPDLIDVQCSGNTCWAVGGYLAQNPSNANQPAFGVVLKASAVGAGP